MASGSSRYKITTASGDEVFDSLQEAQARANELGGNTPIQEFREYVPDPDLDQLQGDPQQIAIDEAEAEHAIAGQNAEAAKLDQTILVAGKPKTGDMIAPTNKEQTDVV